MQAPEIVVLDRDPAVLTAGQDKRAHGCVVGQVGCVTEQIPFCTKHRVEKLSSLSSVFKKRDPGVRLTMSPRPSCFNNSLSSNIIMPMNQLSVFGSSTRGPRIE